MTQWLKQNIRQRILPQREQLPAAARAQFSAEIVRRMVQLPAYQAARTVLGYMNFGSEFKSEILIRQMLADDKTLLLPKVNRTTNELDVYCVADLQHDLAPGVYGIREPLPERCAKLDALDEVDFVLLPGLAFGRDGARLGYGGGFYDKLLMRFDAECALAHRPALVAGAYAMQLVEGIPQETTDHKVQWLVTEHETLFCDQYISNTTTVHADS